MGKPSGIDGMFGWSTVLLHPVVIGQIVVNKGEPVPPANCDEESLQVEDGPDKQWQRSSWTTESTNRLSCCNLGASFWGKEPSTFWVIFTFYVNFYPKLTFWVN